MSDVVGIIRLLIVFVFGALLAVASFVWYFIPKRDAEKNARDAVPKDAEKIDADVAARGITVAKQTAAVDAKTALDHKRDSVELANEIIGGKP